MFEHAVYMMMWGSSAVSMLTPGFPSLSLTLSRASVSLRRLVLVAAIVSAKSSAYLSQHR